MKIPAWLALAVKITLFLLSAIATAASASPSHFGGVTVAGDITFWCTLLNGTIAGISTLVGSGAVPSQTIVGKVAAWIVAGFLAILLLQPHAASAASLTSLNTVVTNLKAQVAAINTKISGANAKIGLTGSITTDANALVAKIQTINLADLRAALDDANKTGDTLASSCYAPLIDLVAAQQSVTVPGQNTDNPGASVPTTHLVLDFQRGRDFYNALRPGSKVSVGCAPLAEQVKTDIATLIAQIAAGTLTMASFGL